MAVTLRRTGWAAVETTVALGAMVAFWLAASSGISIDPLDRIDQVSALAELGFRFVIIAMLLISALALAARIAGGQYFEATHRVACAALAGLAGGFVAGGVALALRGTPYALGGRSGDAGALIEWAGVVRRGGSVPSEFYPPLQIHALAWLADLRGVHAAYALKPFHLAGVGLVAPAAYLAWRLVLRPGWALGIGVVACLPFQEAYRPYPLLVLVVLLPVLVKSLDVVRTAPDRTVRDLIFGGLAIGAGCGVLCLLYSGWFLWSAPGVAVALALVFPWRSGRLAGVIVCGAAGLAFAVVTARYFLGVAHAPAIADEFIYLDVRVQPAYIAMWRGGSPGIFDAPGMWPPPGELGGVGVFSLLLVAGFGSAIAFGIRRTEMLVLGPVIAGTWLLRFERARHLAATHLVQLYPRTTAELLYGLLLASGFAVHYLISRPRAQTSAPRVVGTPAAAIGALAALALLLLFAESATVDRYMPNSIPNDFGALAATAHGTPRLDQSKAMSADVSDPAVRALVDGKRDTVYSSAPGTRVDHEERLELAFAEPCTFRVLRIVPAADGWPADLVVEASDGDTWRVVFEGHAMAAQHTPITVVTSPVVDAMTVRVRAHHLADVQGDRVLRLAELELY